MPSGPKILYIDDEADLLDLAASFFEDENIPIQTCTEFNEAVKLIKDNNYDVVISDAKMPTGSGYDLFHTIRKEGYKGKFVLVTGNIQNIGEEKLEIDMVLFKPIPFEELVASVKKLLKG